MLKIIPPWVFSMGGFRPTISLRRGSVCRRRCRQLSLVQKREHERRIPGRNQVNKLTGAERTEWMGMGEWGNGMIIHGHYGSFRHSLPSTSKQMWGDESGSR